MREQNKIEDHYNEKKTAVTLGKFDGFHKGHQLLIHRIEALSSWDVDSLVVAFDIGDKVLLTKTQERELLMGKVDVLISCPLSSNIKKMSPLEFIEEILIHRLNAKHIVVGSDFRFGYNRKGDINILKDCSKIYGYQLEVIPKAMAYGQEISSTMIKQALENGEIEKANHMLGYEYELSGTVKEGQRLGRTIGFPTLNIAPEKKKFIPSYGVYGCKVKIEDRDDLNDTDDDRKEADNVRCKQEHGGCKKEDNDGKDVDNIGWKEYNGICNIGVKPTATHGADLVVEVHVFDYNGDAYGKNVKVKLLSFLRPERKFDSIDELKEQIRRDVEGYKEF